MGKKYNSTSNARTDCRKATVSGCCALETASTIGTLSSSAISIM